MPPAVHGGSPSPPDTHDLLSMLLEPCGGYVALGWSLERVVLVWRESSSDRSSIRSDTVQDRASTVTRRITPSRVGRARQRLGEALHAGVWEATVGFVRPGGRRFATRVVMAPLRNERGRPTGFAVVSQHHEGTPLRGRAAESKVGAELHEGLDAWLHLATDKPSLRIESVSCRTVVRQVVDALRPMAKRMGLEFETRLPRRDLVVKTDRRALTDILLSLANHAIGLTHRGKIRLEAGALRDDRGRLFSEIRVVGGTRAAAGPSHVQRVGGRNAPATAITNRAAAVYRSSQLAVRLGGRIDVDSRRGRQSAFALVIPNAPARR
jgi:hypothetical protein